MSSRVPVRAGTDADFVELGTGGGEGSAPWACARRAAGEVKCWGSDSFGVLGDGAPSTAQPSPAAIVGPADCIALAVGDTNACVLDAAGAAWCWGRNDHGQLGTGDLTDRDAPTQVATTQRFTRIATYSNDTCALTAAGALWCWGGNGHRELGTEAFTPVHLPAQVPGAPTSVAVSVGSDDVYVLDAEGTVWSSGAWNQGALGRPSAGVDSPMLAPIEGLPPVAQIAGDAIFGALVVAQP